MNTQRARRWAWAEVDLDAVAHNVTVLRETAAPASVWAVVKANGYGHGAVDVARAALSAGAEGLCVALVHEGVALREAGIDAPILLLSEQPVEQIDALLAHRLTPTVYTERFVGALADAVVAAGASSVGAHVKVDSGMQRVGVAPDRVGALLSAIDAAAPAVRVDGVFTHLAVADEPDHPATRLQLAEFDRVLDEWSSSRPRPDLVHAANSAAALAFEDARRSFVRAGIAIYGISPGPGVDQLAAGLRPAMSLRARVSLVKRVRAGSSGTPRWRPCRWGTPTGCRAASAPCPIGPAPTS